MLAPAEWLDDKNTCKPGTVLIVLNRTVSNEKLLRRAWAFCQYHVLLDGAAYIVGKFGLVPDAIVGDGDSVTPEDREICRRHGIEFEENKDQYSSDFMKGFQLVHKSWPEAKELYAYNALGGRVDHSFQSLLCLHLARDMFGCRLYLISTQNVTMLIESAKDGVTVETPKRFLGPTCGLIPHEGRACITTRGLRWDVCDWDTSLRTRVSTSNHLEAETVWISTNHDIIFTVELRDLR